MVAVDASLAVLNGTVLEPLEITDDATSPTERALPTLDAVARTNLVALLAKLEAVRVLLAARLAADVAGTVEVSNAAFPLPDGQVDTLTPQTDALTDDELRASAPAVKDDYQAGECLVEQTGADAVLTFTFASPVQLVHVEGDGAETDVARVDPFGGTPSATRGFRASDGVGVYLPVTCTTVKVWAPINMIVAVQGFGRT